MKIIPDWDRCESNGVCVSIAPEVFDLDDDDNLQIDESAAPAVIEKVRQAVAGCPRSALTLQED
ncbi:MAG: ferredoxin [Nocardiopsaceae bacterium]|nr:ferredoxin [Nocardiopsaceae bacterium]